MSALELSLNLPDNVRRAITLAGEVEKANAGELAPESIEQATEFIRLLASALVHLTHYTLDLQGVVQREHDATKP